MIEPIKWEDEFLPVEVHSYKMIKLALMKRAHLVRTRLADRVNGELGYRGRDYIKTSHGLYRVAMNYNSDNRTETAAHEDMAVTIIHVDNPEEMILFFYVHDLNGEDEYEALRQFLKQSGGY